MEEIQNQVASVIDLDSEIPDYERRAIECEYGEYHVHFSYNEQKSAGFSDALRIFLDGIFGVKYLSDVEKVLDFFDQPRSTRIKDPITFIECGDDGYVADVIALGLKETAKICLIEGWQLINMIAEKGRSGARDRIKKVVGSSEVVCIAELDRVSDNPFKHALAKIINECFQGRYLIFHARKLDKAIDTFCNTDIKEQLKKSELLKISATSVDTVVRWQDLAARVTPESDKVYLPAIFSRLGLFSAIDNKERNRLTEKLSIEVKGKQVPYLREASRSSVYSLHGLIIEKNGPVLCLNDHATIIFILSLFLNNPNAEGKVVTNWTQLVRGFDLDSKTDSRDCINSKKRSVSRLRSADIKIINPEDDLIIYHGSFVAEYLEVKKGRYSTVTIYLSQTLAKQMIQYKKISAALLDIPQLSFAIYSYMLSNKKTYDMKYETWHTIVGRNYAEYRKNMRKFKEGLRGALKDLEDRKLIKSGWKMTTDGIERLELEKND